MIEKQKAVTEMDRISNGFTKTIMSSCFLRWHYPDQVNLSRTNCGIVVGYILRFAQGETPLTIVTSKNKFWVKYTFLEKKSQIGQTSSKGMASPNV
jgi:hypothetical protein